ncbi:hypothetical protein F3Y22_tig00110299pilonHSYRG00262 [Hibiscus syriacus]|uniref:Multiple C2 domain-containing protein n=1 Tax=Hibiscus syriacus TaxID=106335 RepID=A0A6A3B621_HIBSY|nr:hypothetical protein F3Y22_tig00110299pilonHSYRG00262 [Hibiscus syriacus]
MLAVWMGTQGERHFPIHGIRMLHRLVLMPSQTSDRKSIFPPSFAAEPFEEPLVLSVEDRVGSNKDETLGMCMIPLHILQRRLDHKPADSKTVMETKHWNSGTGHSKCSWTNANENDEEPQMLIVWPSMGRNGSGLGRSLTTLCHGGRSSTLGRFLTIMRLSRAEPPLRKEVVEYMLDVDSLMWSMRRSKANFFRIMGVLSGLIAVGKCFSLPFPSRNLELPLRPRHPPHMDTRLSHADAARPDELDEEFDTFPTSRPSDIVRMRYDRIRSIGGRVQTVIGDLATQGERFQSLLSWRDPRATTDRRLGSLHRVIPSHHSSHGSYVLQHPRFRHKLPSTPLNFFRRLPARSDSML